MSSSSTTGAYNSSPSCLSEDEFLEETEESFACPPKKRKTKNRQTKFEKTIDMIKSQEALANKERKEFENKIEAEIENRKRLREEQEIAKQKRHDDKLNVMKEFAALLGAFVSRKDQSD